MSLILESRLSKQDIFALYCNDVYLGQSGRYAIRGFAEAAEAYFDKKLNDLTLAESAFLAGLVHAPNRYSARRDPSHALARRKEVLDAMVELEGISSEEAERAQLEPLQFVKHEAKDDLGLSYFIDYTERFVEERYGWRALASQTRLNTTLDMRLQQAAYDSVVHNTERIDRLTARKGKKRSSLPPVQAALVAIDPHSGEILAMIGGRNYDESQLNRATDAFRQPGSTFKPFIYASALSRRSCTAATLLSDRPQSFSYDGGRSQYKPTDYGGGFGNRDVTLGEALSRSLNVPTVQLAEEMGISTIANFAESCGLPKPRLYLSTALGASEVTLLDLAAGYTTFAGDGIARRPTPVKGICWPETDISEAVVSSSTQPLSPQTAFLITDMSRSVLNGGTASRARTLGFKGDAAGKTGTSRDGWFVGYTPNLLCAVWVGFDDNRDLGLKGSDSALPIWVDFMKRALEIRPELGGKFSQPGGLTSALIDPTTGLLACDKCPRSQLMLFLSGTEPMSMCTHDLPEEETVLASEESESPADQGGDDEATGELSGEVTFEVCSETGLLPSSECRSLKERIVTWRDLPIGTCRPELHKKGVPPADDKHP
jgi:penicillin-binding protein 1B